MSRRVGNAGNEVQEQDPRQAEQPPNPDEEQVLTTPDEGGEGGGGLPWIMGEGEFDDEEEPPQPTTPPAPAPGQQPPQPGQPPRQPQQPSAPGQSQTGQQFEVKVGELVFRGPTAQAAVDAAALYMDRRQQAPAQYKPRELPQRGYHPQPQEAAGPQWNDEEWYQTLAKDPRAAMDAWAKHYFGVDNPVEAFNYAYETSQAIDYRVQTADFLGAVPDYNATPENAKILMDRINEDGQIPTTHNLEVAFRQLVREGKMAPLEQSQRQQPNDYRSGYEDQGQPQPPQVPPSRGEGAPQIPPDRGGGGEGNPPGPAGAPGRPMTLAEFEALSAPEMKAYIESRSPRNQAPRMH